jgi:phosphoglycolate phosphatase-like HAD superfamily hydrolase
MAGRMAFVSVMTRTDLVGFSGAVEWRDGLVPERQQVTEVVFDFDGTLSWIRHGWPRMMLGLFRRHYPACGISDVALRERFFEGIVFGMNGQPTIQQMTSYADAVRECGGPEYDPEALRSEFQAELDAAILRRVDAIRAGKKERDAYVVHGAQELLEFLQGKGLRLWILSSSLQHRVREEAEILGLSGYFGDRIFGSTGDPRNFSKARVFEEILRRADVGGERILSFGDGPVEIRDTRSLGGIAVGVCTDEDDNGSGVVEPGKRSILLNAGAQVILPDFRDAARVFSLICGGPVR